MRPLAPHDMDEVGSLQALYSTELTISIQGESPDDHGEEH